MTQDWTAFVVETITGQVVAELPLAAAPTFDIGINTTGSGSAQVPLGGTGMDKNQLDPITEPWRFSIAIAWRNNLMQAGPIPDESFQDSAGNTTVAFNGLWSLFTKRLVFPIGWSSGNPATTTADVTYTNLTLRQIAKRLVYDNIQRPNCFVPMAFDPDDPAGTSTRTYYGYEMNKVADMLTNIVGVDGGPEIEFRPQWTSTGRIQWYMRTGSPRLGQIGSPWVWDYGERGALRAVDYQRNGSAIAGNWYARGAGEKYGTVIGHVSDTTLISARFPLLEEVDGNHTDVTVQSTADGWAAADMNTYHWPTHTFTAIVQIGGLDKSYRQTGSPSIDQIAVGDTGRFVIQDHRRIPDGSYTLRIIGIANNTADSVKLTLQPTTYL